MLSHSGNGCWSQLLVIYIRYTQAKWVVGHVWLSCKMFLLNSSVSFLEYTDRKVVPYLVIVGNPLPNTCLRFWLYTIYVEREMKAFLLDDYYIVLIDIIIISKGFWYKDIWILIREKPVPLCGVVLWDIVYLFIYLFKLFYSYQSHDWPGVYFVVFPKLLGA